MSQQQIKHIRILALDDEPHILFLYRDTLSPAASAKHFDLILCHRAREAVEAVQTAVSEKNPFAVAFLDIRLPGGHDGIWAAEQIRALDPHIEIVMVTAYSDVTPDDVAQRVPPMDKLLYLQKPFHHHEIKQFALALSSKWHGGRELRQIHAELEARVEERTTELINLNEQLRQDIARRRRAEAEVQSTLGKLRKTLGGTIQAIAQTVESRDPYTAGHQRRVSDLARSLAVALALPTHQIDGIRMAGLIHDLGKICVPAEILSKPGHITEIEHSLIKSHPQIGYDILSEIEFPWPLAQTVIQHHERIDGSGYPAGLCGDDILLEARILAVADVVEAMASHRPYRPTLGIEKALEEISTNRGILYEAEVVDVCLRLFQEDEFQFRM
jgi:HD-GYP domain-containing protein (c-di-GMP phosphodiesterase class II)